MKTVPRLNAGAMISALMMTLGLAGQAWLARLHAKESGIPYGIALALSALMVYPETEWVKAIDLTHLALR